MIRTLFPTSVYEAPLGGRTERLRRELLQECFQIRDYDVPGRKWSKANYPGGYTSYGTEDRLHRMSSTFMDLELLLNRHVEKFAKHLDMDVKPRSLKMSTCWVNIMPAGVVHSMHIHPLSAISGTFYVQTPPGGGALKFEDPRLECFMGSPPRKTSARVDNRRHVSLNPKAGNVILFESWTRHEVPANQSTEERISISFNYDWTGR